MKKILFSILLGSFLTASVSLAQNTSETFANKDNVIALGFGIGGVYGFSSYDAQSPVLGAFYERGIMEFKFGGVLGVGGFLGYKTYQDKIPGYYPYDDDYKIRSNVIILGTRGSMHYDVFKVKNLDTYGSVMVAFHIVNETDNFPDGHDYDTHANAAYASIHAGARYYFTPKFAAYAEVGYGVYWLGMGVNFKF